MELGQRHISRVYGKIVAEVGEFDIDVTHKFIVTGPNGYGKTIILKLTNSMYQLMRGDFPSGLKDTLSATRVSYFDESTTTWYRIFERFGMVLDDGTEATLEPAYESTADNQSTYIYRCGDETLQFDLATLKKDSPRPVPRTNGKCIFLDSWRHERMAEIIANIIMENGVSADDLKDIAQWHRKLFELGNGQDMLIENFKLPMPDELPRKFMKRVETWVERLSHGEQEILLCLLALRHADVMILDDAGQGLHLCVQENFISSIRLNYGRCQLFFSTHMPTLLDGNWDADYELYQVAHPEKFDPADK